MTTFITIGTITLTEEWQYTDIVVSSYFRLTHLTKPLDANGVAQSSSAVIAQVNLGSQVFEQQVFNYFDEPERLIIEPPAALDIRKMALKLLPGQLPWTVKVEVLNIENGTLVLDPIDFPGGMGPKGDKGDTGAAGPPGPKGDTGNTGAAGLQGPKGDDGAAGVPGPKGDTGNTGAAGPQGLPGNDGATGAPGLPGPKGEVGADGPQGVQGPQGLPGNDGAPGAPGPKGDTGNTGAAGPQGLPGNDGAPGAPGPKGDTGDTGAAGPQGLPGNDGAPGPQGVQGPQGLPGNDGAAGPPGPKGDTGDTGAAGPQGPQGLPGNDGAAGAPGPKGDTGNTGAVGPQGPQGLPGTMPAPIASRTAADVTVANSAADTVLVNETLPAFAIGDSFAFEIWGRALNNSGAGINFVWKVLLDNTTVLSTGNVALATGGTPRRWNFSGVATIVSATQIRVKGVFFLSTTATDTQTMAAQQGTPLLGDSGTVAYGSTGPKAFNFNGQMLTANANASLTIRGAMIYKR